MTKREKEFEELNDLIFKHSSEGSLGLLAREIQDRGYTKKHFPVEKLEEWLNEIKENYEKYNFENIRLFGKNPIQVVLDKIKELEDG